MKAVVLEKKNHIAVVLKEDGTVVKTRQECEVGDEIFLKEDSVIRIGRFSKKAVAAASVAVVALFGTTGYVYAAPTSYVTVDVNPSFEFALNRFERVVSVEALNEDAEEIVKQYKKQSTFAPTLEEALAVTSELLYESEYLGENGEQDVIINAVSDSDKKSEKLTATAKEAFAKAESSHGDTLNIRVSIASKEERKKAKEEGLSTGQFIEKETAVEPDGTNPPPNNDVLPENSSESEIPSAPPVENSIASPKQNDDYTGSPEENENRTAPAEEQMQPEQGNPPAEGENPTPTEGQAPPNGTMTPPDGKNPPPERP